MMLKKISKISLLLFLLSFAFQNLSAQEDARVSGIILDRGTGARLADVNVVNLRNNKKTSTNTFGVFFLEAAVGDSLSFSKIGYGPLKTILFSMEDVLLEMQAGLEIETVVVSKKSREQEMSDILKDYEKKGIYNGGNNKVGTYLNSPATALYNLFGREAKNMRRFQKFMDREVDAMAVDRIFSKKAVGDATELDGEELQNFMDLYRPSSAQVESWGQYDLLHYISKSFEQWKKDGRPAAQRLPKLDIPPQN